MEEERRRERGERYERGERDERGEERERFAAHLSHFSLFGLRLCLSNFAWEASQNGKP